MGIRLITCLALISALAVASSEKFRYDGYHVISVNIENEEQRDFVERLDASTNEVQLLEPAAVNRRTMLIIAPHELTDIENMLTMEGLVPQVETTNLQKFIDDEQPETIPREFGWTAYYTLEKIYAWLDEKIEQYPKLFTNYAVGTTYENRTIRAVKLSHNPGKPTIFIESNIHAREWVTAATATYFLNELLTSKNASIVHLAQNYDWVIIPVFNVDGYAYTHSQRRMWRKNRQPSATSPQCIGVDVNRNFDVNFGGPGTSNFPCAETYRGPSALSEKESSSMSQFIGNFTNTKLFLSFHLYGQYLMFPYGNTNAPAPNFDHLNRIGRKSADAISRRYRTSYRVGQIYSTIYPAASTATDWAYVRKNISLSYVFEFRPIRGSGIGGFALPAAQIIPNSEEVIDGIVAMVAEANVLNYL